METKEISKKREWVKNAAIIFLAVLLLLTFLSNTILNRSLPEVATRSITSGSITARIRVTGTVSANQSYEVSIDESRRVRSVMVRSGQEVQAGDVLFVLSDGAGEELEAAQDSLRALQKSYQEALINASEADYARENLELRRLREDLAEKQAERDALSYSATELAQAQALLDAAVQKETAQKQVAAAANAAVNALKPDVDTAKADVISAQAEVNRIAQELEDAGFARDHANGNYSAVSRVNAAEQALSQAQSDRAAAEQTYATELEQLRTLTDAALRAEELSDEAYEQLWPEYMERIANENRFNNEGLYNAYTAWAAAVQAEEEAQQELDEARAALSSGSSASGSYGGKSYAEWERECRRLEVLLQEAKSALSKAESALNTAEARLSAAREKAADAEQTASAATAERNAAEAALAEQEAKQSEYEARCDALDAELKSMTRALEDALLALQTQQKNDNRQASLDSLNLQEMATQVARQQQRVDELGENATEQEVTAPVGGVIQSLSVTAGQTTIPQSPMATIELPDMGYTMSASVTNDQARRVHTGDAATAANMYWGTQIDAVLTGVTADPRDPQNSKLLTFELSGDVTPGASLTLSVGERSADYDYVVPGNAIRSDANGDFLLIVSAKNSPLGDRYTATRVNVTKLAADDTNVAVSGALNFGDFVITTSTAPIKNGDRVRLADAQNET